MGGQGDWNVDRVARMKEQKEHQTGRSRGFAFVEMTNTEDGERAIAALNGTQLGGRTINVNEARPKVEGRGERDRGFETGGRGRGRRG
jgi:cold-inducible RNA-binding protein